MTFNHSGFCGGSSIADWKQQRLFGFMKFESDDVAKIVAETMNSYHFGERP